MATKPKNSQTRKQPKPGASGNQRPEQLHAQLSGPQVVEAIDRGIQRLETLVNEAGNADREKIDQIKVQIQGTNYLIGAQMKKLNKVIPDAKMESGSLIYQPTRHERMAAALYGMQIEEYIEREREGTLPPRAPIPGEEGYEEYKAACSRGDRKEAEKYKKLCEGHRALSDEDKEHGH